MSKPIFTPKLTEKSLCVTCKHATVTEGKTYKDRLVRCYQHRGPVMFDVVDCSDYTHKNTPSLYELNQIAWPILVDKKGNMIGFRAPKEAAKLIESGKAEVDGQPNEDLDW